MRKSLRSKFSVSLFVFFSTLLIFLACQTREFGADAYRANLKRESTQQFETGRNIFPKRIEEFNLKSYERELNSKLDRGIEKAFKVLEKGKKVSEETCNIQFSGKERNLESPVFILDREFHPSNFAFALAFGAYDTSWDTVAMTTQLQNWGFSNVEFLYENNWGLHAFVAWNKTFAVLHYRGTYNLGGAVLDAMFKDIRPNEMKDQSDPAFQGRVHFGFWRAFMALRNGVREALDKATAAAPDLPLVVTGHSLGGATALLASLDARKNGKNVVSVYTTAQPRVGNEEFAKSVKEKLGESYFRLMLKGDVVSHVPPTKDGIKWFSNAWSFLSKIVGAVPPFLMQRETYRHAGRVFVFENPEPSFMEDTRSDAEQDIVFWKERGQKFSIEGFVYHPPLFYLCHFAAIYNEKIRNWGANLP